jgi:uncharacterized membrane protein YsdA (DUF1294 family)
MKQVIVSILTGYVILMSLIGFSSMGIDKHKARKKVFRIPERTLMFLAFTGGGIGSFLGMYFFRHKTKHIKFVLLFPLAALLYLLFLLRLYYMI